MHVAFDGALRQTEELSDGLVAEALLEQLNHPLLGLADAGALRHPAVLPALLMAFPEFMGQQLQGVQPPRRPRRCTPQGNRGQHRESSMGRAGLLLEQMPELNRIMRRLLLRQGKRTQLGDDPRHLTDGFMPAAVGQHVQSLAEQPLLHGAPDQDIGVDHNHQVVVNNHHGSGHSAWMKRQGSQVPAATQGQRPNRWVLLFNGAGKITVKPFQ